MPKKPILTDDELDGGVPVPEMAPKPPAAPAGSATRPLDAPPQPPADNRTRLVDDTAPPEARDAPDRAGRDASGHARPKTRIHAFGRAGKGAPGDEMMADEMRTGDAAMDAMAMAPVVGWLVVTAGPGRGASCDLVGGMNAIGRGDENAVQLDFGDDTISRDPHAFVTYDDETRMFHLSHGGKTNIVRLNDAPVLATETLKSGDIIRIGATRLRFVALCGVDFDWSDA